MLKISRIIFSVICFALAIYLFFTQNFKVMPFMNLALGGVLLTMGCAELKAKRKMNAIFSFLAVSIVLFAAIYTFFVFYIYTA